MLVALLAVAGALRLAVLGQRQLVEGDGVHYASLARRIMIGDLSGLANPYWSNLWPGVVAVTGLATGLDAEGGGRLASLICGVLLAALTAILGTRIFGPLEGAATGLMVGFHPWLVEFSTLVFSESFFSLLLLLLLLASFEARDAASPRRLGVVGLVAGTAIVTRPEAFGAFAVVCAWLGATTWRRVGIRRTVGNLAILLSIVAALVAVRALLVHRYSGQWDFGPGLKGTANLLVGLAPTDVEKERTMSALNADGENDLAALLRETTLTGFFFAHPRLVLSHTADNLLVLLRCAERVFPPLPVAMGREPFVGGDLDTAIDVGSAACLGLAALGLASGLKTPRLRPGAGLCGSVIVVHLLGLAPLYVHERLVVAVVPLFLVFLGGGLVVAGRAAHVAAAGVLLCLPLLAALSVHGVVRTRWFDYASERVVQKQAGLWLKEHFPQDLRLMTVTPSIAFYFYDARHQENEVGLPFAAYPALLEHARRERVDLVAASEWQLPVAGFPAARELLPEGDHPGLDFIASIGQAPERVHVFRVRGSGAAGGGEGPAAP